ncbi:DNA adenine methylase [Macrococcus armenti]|uniref:DNA adenine methylase n=1 Tax=Macrococcus armenti TaxID=2875764 RepID=UPI001CCCF83E|nr:Dam family site-specific DNA-(adenine-N6)-methyltransferase [Macrococcus armenti]UBH15787.1 Dam family site-specific DNA-(adenine-N6)-methyltransferase [Macrococcus armenti]UBH18146.1 Dam family site-specific DNA-(adenine-N6)-methyltransferase [Macrococcus armenti]UBH20413.1 Dam family site-specific DNA-(adenine-N6)-methyltransferase [Macrococcus armenti]
MLPKEIIKIKVPPIKIQGIKTKLVPFIAESIQWDGNGTYFEPFMGSGVVGFNLEPKKAVFSDTNPHIIRFYKDIQNGTLNAKIVRNFLENESKKLSSTPADKTSYYYEVRNRFNKSPNSLDFLFLQRSNFNGMIRFNKKGEYNVPFGRKPERFQKSLITKIVNQVNWIEQLFYNKDWEFKCQNFISAFEQMSANDFVYLDPPYIDRHDGYYESWSNESALLLADLTQNGKAGFALSMWYENSYRKNSHLNHWKNGVLLTTDHFYHIGAKQTNRNKMTEALFISQQNVNKNFTPNQSQLSFFN